MTSEGVRLIDDVSMEQQGGERDDPKSNPNSRRGVSRILSDLEVALRPYQYFTSFVCPTFPLTYAPRGVQRISAYLNNASFVIRVIRSI